MLKFVSMAGLNVPVVAHRTTGDVMTGMLSGTIQAAVETIPGAIGQIKDGQMRAIAVSSTEAQSVPAGRADRRRKRRAGLPDLFVERHGGAGQDAAGRSSRVSTRRSTPRLPRPTSSSGSAT